MKAIDTQNWTPVLWITLTDRNGRNHEQHIRDVERFLTVLSRRIGVHLKCLVGGDKVWNVHTHVAVLIPNDELAKFSKRRHRFNKSYVWEFKTCNKLGFQEWDWERSGPDGWITYNYIQKVEHNFQSIITVCPMKKSCCRNHCCPHHGSSSIALD